MYVVYYTKIICKYIITIILFIIFFILGVGSEYKKYLYHVCFTNDYLTIKGVSFVSFAIWFVIFARFINLCYNNYKNL